MCGIAGYIDFAGESPCASLLEAMAHSLRHRGPDASGILVDGTCGMAHTRLSIIDIAGSFQPMRLPGSDISLAYNGELYNYRELREGMRAAGEGFVTQGDTEVVLRCIGRQWTQALSGFDGMFAIAAWDRRREVLLLARDPIGEKPLFFAQPRPDLLIFGSEIKAVLEHAEVDRMIDLNALRQVLRFRAVYGTQSLHCGVKQLEPGSFLEFGRNGIRTGRFYDLASEVPVRKSLHSVSEDHLVKWGEELLVSSVRERLVADVPVGAFLSGGLDSSLIVAIMKQHRDAFDRIRTFCVSFSGDRFSEASFAKLVAELIGTEHTEVRLGEDEYTARLAQMTFCRDAPISEPADVAIAHMSAVAKQSVKVVLSGEGSDEVFGGYPKYLLAAAPGLLRRSLRLLGPRRVSRLASFLGLDARRTLIAARALSHPRELDRLVQWFSYMDRLDLHSLLPGLEWSDDQWSRTTASQDEALRQWAIDSPIARMQAVDCLTWLPCNLLERADRMTMAEGLELRPPFLDRELVSFGLTIRDRLKVRGRATKWIVRRWASKRLPPEIVHRRKWGFRVPLAEWFRGRMRDMLFDYLTNSRGLCGNYGERDRVVKLLHAHDSGRVNADLALWTLLAAEIWYQDVYLPRLGEPSSLGAMRR